MVCGWVLSPISLVPQILFPPATAITGECFLIVATKRNGTAGQIPAIAYLIAQRSWFAIEVYINIFFARSRKCYYSVISAVNRCFQFIPPSLCGVCRDT